MDKDDRNRTVDPFSGDALARMDEVSREYVLKRGKILSKYVERMNGLRLGPELDALEIQYQKECADLYTQYAIEMTKRVGEKTMLEESIPELDSFIGKPGDLVPVVAPADLKALWTYSQDLRAENPTGGVGTGIEIFRQMCSPGANTGAVWYRCQMLGLLAMMLESAWVGGKLTEAAFTVAAQMELKRMGFGVAQKGLPFDVGEFLGQVYGLSQYAGSAGHRTV
jgi:hypothetical protein